MSLPAGSKIPFQNEHGVWAGEADASELGGGGATYRGAWDAEVQYLPGDLVFSDFMGFPFSSMAVLPNLGLVAGGAHIVTTAGGTYETALSIFVKPSGIPGT